MNDTVRAAILALFTSAVSALVLLGLLHWSAEQAAAVDLVISNAIVVTFLLFKKGQAAGPPSSA